MNNNKTIVSVENIEIGDWIYNSVFGICLVEARSESKFVNEKGLKIANLGFFSNNEKCLRTELYSKVILIG